MRGGVVRSDGLKLSAETLVAQLAHLLQELMVMDSVMLLRSGVDVV
jgi:hypothetical protein